MFKLISCSFGVVAVAVLATAVLVLLMTILPQAMKSNKRLSSMSFLMLALFGVLLLSANVIFGGLVKTKNLLEDVEQSSEYRVMQYADDALSTYAPNLHIILEDVLGEDYTTLQLQRKKESVNKYLWIDGIVVVVFLVLGLLLVIATMEGGAPMRRAYSGDGDSAGRVHRSHERSQRSRHRSSY